MNIKMMCLSAALTLCVYIEPPAAAELANIKKDSAYPGSSVTRFGDDLSQAKGQIDGISYKHNIGAWALGIVSNQENQAPENLTLHYNWSVGCEIDAFENKRWCTVTFETGDSVHFWTDGREVCSPINTFPGRRVSFKVDTNPVYTVTDASSSNSCLGTSDSKTLLSQMKTGSVVRIRVYEWPYEEPLDLKISTYGFTAAGKLMAWMRKNIE